MSVKPADETTKIGSAEWDRWLTVLDPFDRALVLIQNWAVLEIGRRKLYDSLLRTQTDDKFSQEMKAAFNRACIICGIEPADMETSILATIEELAETIEGK